tara:strand:+ start:712 stop:1053 length:342 start_codon:yes stop_codon:yes gene_type:complete
MTVFNENKPNIESAKEIIEKYPDRVPVYIEKGDTKIKEQLKKNKYLVPKDINMGQFMYIIRKQLKIRPEDAIFIFCNNTIIPTSEILYDVYDKYKHKETGFLMMKYYKEGVFG